MSDRIRIRSERNAAPLQRIKARAPDRQEQVDPPAFALLGNIGSVATLGLVAAYISGFLIVNAHLGAFGIQNTRILGSGYLIPGAGYLLLIAIYAVIPGHAIVSRHRDAESLRDLLEAALADRVWARPLADFAVLLRAMFLLTVIATTMGMLTSTVQPTRWEFMALMAAMTGEIASQTRVRYTPKTFMPEIRASMVLWAVATIALAWIAFESYFTYLTLGFLCAFLLFALTDKSTSRSQRRFYVLWGAIAMLVMFSGSYGRYIYATLRQAFGGPQINLVEVALKQDASIPTSLIKVLGVNERMTKPMTVLFESEDTIWLNVPIEDQATGGISQAIAIARDQIAAIRIHPNERSRLFIRRE